ncbi:unnamed protein product [Pleuronectes platessa]|uniref:Uncharacterized protein n=1 Tax=Pleuronectes platessa TaxID=8262 RepID=A0A9N7YH81_PLEPL|nr:unnamed protein product [Pleuronectes platessa]
MAGLCNDPAATRPHSNTPAIVSGPWQNTGVSQWSQWVMKVLQSARSPGSEKVHTGAPGCSGSRALWQGTKDNTQTTDGLCCLPPSHEASAGSRLRNPLSNRDACKMSATKSGGERDRRGQKSDSSIMMVRAGIAGIAGDWRWGGVLVLLLNPG